MIVTDRIGVISRQKTDLPSASSGPEGQRQRAKSLNRNEFFAAIIVHLRRRIPNHLYEFRHRANPMLLKIDYGHERIHFEVWPDAMRRQIEIGLHFEDGPESTAAYLAYFDARIVEIKHQLGPRIELERWTASWGHIFELADLEPLNHDFARAVTDRLIAQMTVLQPMVEEAAVPPEVRADAATGRGKWARRARR